MLQIKKYVHVPTFVDAVQVTEDNMVEVARWCNGQIHATTPEDGSTPANYIKVHVVRPQNPRQAQAFAGDWVLRMGGSFKVFAVKAFEKSFLAVSEEPCGSDETPDGQPCVLGKGHRAETDGVIIGCRSLQDYLVLRNISSDDSEEAKNEE